MSNRIVRPQSTQRRNRPSEESVILFRRKAALERAQNHAAGLREQAREARWAAMSPTQRAKEINLLAASAENEAARLSREFNKAEPPPLPAPPSPEAVARALAENAVAASRTRSAELHSLGINAAKLGVDFDVAKAIASGMSLAAARGQVMDLAADASEAITLQNRPSGHMVEAVDHAAGWNAALEAVAARNGLTLR